MWFTRGRLPPDESYVSPLIKYLLFAFNIFFWLFSITVIIVASWALATKHLNEATRIASLWDFIFDVTILMLIAGFIANLLATLGCIGALRENVIVLRVFWISLVVIFVLALVVGIVGLCLSNRLLELVKQKIGNILIEKYWDDSDRKDIMDYTQEEFKCCGLSDKGYLDWNSNAYFNCYDDNPSVSRCGVPHSCCRSETRYDESRMENRLCGADVLTEASSLVVNAQIYTTGCVEAVLSSGKRNIITISIVILGLSLVPLIGVFLTMTLISQIEDQKARWVRTHRPSNPPSRNYRYIH